MMNVNILDLIGSMDAVELKKLWRDADEVELVREEALWEYWRRVAENEVPYSDAELLEVLSSDNARVADVVGLLTIHNLLVGNIVEHIRKFRARVDDTDWVAIQLDAREMLCRIKAGANPPWNDVCEALVAKGTFWAAIEAIPLLSPNQVKSLVEYSEEQRIFTKKQLHDLRVRASRNVEIL